MKTSFKILYFLNLSILILGLIWQIGGYIVKVNLYNEMLFEYWIISMAGSVSVCFTFLILNIYGMLKYNHYRTRFLFAIILVSIWMVTGIYHFLYAYLNNISIWCSNICLFNHWLNPTAKFLTWRRIIHSLFLFTA